MNTQLTRLTAAALGVGALLTAAGVTLVGNETATAGVEFLPAAPEATLGATQTEERAPSRPETSVAVPPITTAPYTIPTGEVQ